MDGTVQIRAPGHLQTGACRGPRLASCTNPRTETTFFVLDSDADEAVDDERFMLESMSLTQIKARCFGKCYVARSPMLMQKMSDASTENRPHV